MSAMGVKSEPKEIPFLIKDARLALTLYYAIRAVSYQTQNISARGIVVSVEALQ